MIKVVYVIRDNKHLGKSPAMMSIFLDRLLGLSALFTIGLFSALGNIQQVSQSTTLSSVVTSLVMVCAGIGAFFFAALYDYKKMDPFREFFQKKYFGFNFVLKLYDSVRIYRKNKTAILKSFGLSLLIQIFTLALFLIFTLAIIPEQNPSLIAISTIFPLGIFTSALPISPGGLGVGHVAFDSLFNLIGYTGGASIFNVFILSQIFLNLLGVIPYLSLKQLEKQKDQASITSS